MMRLELALMNSTPKDFKLSSSPHHFLLRPSFGIISCRMMAARMNKSVVRRYYIEYRPNAVITSARWQMDVLLLHILCTYYHEKCSSTIALENWRDKQLHFRCKCIDYSRWLLRLQYLKYKCSVVVEKRLRLFLSSSINKSTYGHWRHLARRMPTCSKLCSASNDINSNKRNLSSSWIMQ